MRGPETVGAGVAGAVADGDAEAFALNDGCTLAGGEQAASRKTLINSKRAGTPDITKAAPISYSDALGFLRADGIFGYAGASLGSGAIAARRRRPGHRLQPLHRPDGPHRHPAALHAGPDHRADVRGPPLRRLAGCPPRHRVDAPVHHRGS